MGPRREEFVTSKCARALRGRIGRNWDQFAQKLYEREYGVRLWRVLQYLCDERMWQNHSATMLTATMLADDADRLQSEASIQQAAPTPK